MTGRQSLCTALALLAFSSGGLGVQGQESSSKSQAAADDVFGDIRARTNGDPVLVTRPRYAQWDVRFGWWGFWNNGSPAKVGEYQDIKPSPFWDVDGFSSDGARTLAITATGNDNETTTANVYLFGPGATVKLDYDRYLHRRDHDPLDNMADLDPTLPNSPGGTDPLVMKQDLNVGQDYAVRVQELKGSIKGIYDDGNIKVRLDIWGLKKEGTRQTNLTAMCYNRNVSGAALPPDHLGLGGADLGTFTGARCHVLSQAQRINWLTMEVKPVVEARLSDRFTVEYSRPMRGFTADDQGASRFYDVTGSLTYNATTSNNPPLNPPNADPYLTGVVPDSYTEMDQLKIGGDLTENTKAYAFLMVGHTVNREIDMTRWFNNVDLRLTNSSIDNVRLTGFGKVFNEDEQMPSLANVTALETYNNTRPSQANWQPTLEHPINYHKTTAGLKGTWRPGGYGFDRGGLAIVGGYEYDDLQRKYAIFESDTTPVVTLDESTTITHGFQVGPYYRWSPQFDTYLRYKFQNANQPLIGFKPLNGIYNTLLPENDHIVELGFDWFPSDWFMMNLTVGIERAVNHSQYADFGEENYPLTFSAWYAMTRRLSVSAGYAIYSNFVGQDITVGDDAVGSTVPPVSGQWSYGGRAQVLTFGSRYALTEAVRLTGDLEFVRGHNQITNSPVDAFAISPELGTYSEVLNESAQFAWARLENSSTYRRLRPIRALQLQRQGSRLPNGSGPRRSGRTLGAVLDSTASLSRPAAARHSAPASSRSYRRS